jgi:hypothetical protein
MTNTMEWEKYRDAFDKSFNEAIDRGEPAIVVAWVLAKKLTEKLLTTARKEGAKEEIYQLNHLCNYDATYAAGIGEVVPVSKISKLIDALKE